MDITIKENGFRFGVRAGAIIYNEDKTKVLLENQGNGRFMFPGGRINFFEDSFDTIIRELKEELGLDADLKLKYIVEMFLTSLKKYHEIGFYYLTSISEKDIQNGFNSLDGGSVFEWVLISELESYNVLTKPVKDKIINNEVFDGGLEHLYYRS